MKEDIILFLLSIITGTILGFGIGIGRDLEVLKERNKQNYQDIIMKLEKQEKILNDLEWKLK